MASEDTTGMLLARLASAERALARRRVEGARAQGLDANAWWDSARASVAMLVRHHDIAALVSDTLAKTPAGAWDALLPPLDRCSLDALRTARATWRAQLSALARGEGVEVAEIPPDAGVIPVEPVEVPRPPQPVELDTPKKAATRALDDETVRARLARWIDRFFDRPAEPREGPKGESLDDEAPRAWFEVAPRGDGSLALWAVCSPVQAFPPMVKVLRASMGASRTAVRRENLAVHGARFEAAPTAAPLSWTTGDDDDDRDLSKTLGAMAPAPLAADRATAFRLDIEGSAQRLEGTTLSRGARYAIVAPSAEGAAWTLDVIDVPALVTEELVARLGTLGLSLGALALTASWVLCPPTRWELTPRGERYAVFDRGATPVARLHAGVARSDLAVFLHGDASRDAYALASVEEADVALPDLAPGRYVLEFTSCDAEVSPARLSFVVAEGVARSKLPVTAPSVTLDDASHSAGETLVADLSSLTAERALVVTGPPAMAVSLRWEGVTAWDSGALSLDATGRAPLDVVLARTAPLRESAPEASLTIDFGEWGAVRVRHRRRIDDVIPSAREALRKVGEMRAMAASGVPSLALAWLRMVAEALGFSPREVLSALPAVALDDVEFERDAARTVTRAALALVPVGAKLRTREEPLRRAIEDACGAVSSRVFVTDGARWWDLDLRKSAAPMPDALDAALDDDDALAGFLARYGAWR